MTSKEFLERVNRINKQIDEKKAKIEQLSSVASGMTANNGGDRVQSSGSQQRMADAVEECIDLEREIKQLEWQKQDVKCEILHTIQPLCDNFKSFLISLYINETPMSDIAIMRNKSYSWATTTHQRAKDKLQIILDMKGGADDE